jgi:hypothetical protein
MKPFRTEQQIALNFTKENGISIQTQHLNEWKSVLSAIAYEKLFNLVTKSNKKAYDGFDIVRGNEIDEILRNKIIKY